jgi:hypothetical protein
MMGERLALLALNGGIIILGSTQLIMVWDRQGPTAEVTAAGSSAIE